MSTESLLRAQSAERLSESGYSSDIYFRKNSQQPGQNLKQKGGLDNPGFERDFQETNSREHITSNRDAGNVINRSRSVQQVMEGKNIDDAGRKQVNSRIRPNDGYLKRVGLQRQRPKTTSGQDLRRKALINSLKLRRARSASYVVVPDENYEDDVFRDNGVFQETLPKNKTDDRSTGTLQNMKITKEKSLQHLSQSVHDTEKENSHLREYSRRLTTALQERARLTETLHVLSRGVYLNKTNKEREPPEVNRTRSAMASISAENIPYVRGNSFEERGASQSKENRHLPETPVISERNKRGTEEDRPKPNAAKERRQNFTEEVSASAHGKEVEKERKKRAVAKLAENVWRSQINGETFQTNDSPFVEDQNTNDHASDWGKANNTDVTAGLIDQSEANRTRRRAAFRKQISFHDEAVNAALERRHGLKLTRDYPDEKSTTRYTYEGATTQMAETKSARSRDEELHRRSLHERNPGAKSHSRQPVGKHEEGQNSTIYSRQPVRKHDEGQNSTSHSHQQVGKHGERQNSTMYSRQPVGKHDEGQNSTSHSRQQVGKHDEGQNSTSHSRQQVGKHGERQNSTMYSRQPVGKHDEGQNSTSHSRQQVGKHAEGQNSIRHSRQQVGKHDQGQNTNGKYSGNVEKESANYESKLEEREASQDNSGSRTSPLIAQQDHLNNNHVDMASNRSSYNGSFREDNFERAYKNGRNNKTESTYEIPSYDISLMRKRLPQSDGNHGNGWHDDKSTQLTDAYMATDDAEKRRELQRRAASEAAVLRREASNLLWKAMDLERICDENARVRQVSMPY